MRFQNIVVQPKAKKLLQQGLQSGKISHAYIFSGPAGTGKRDMALALAQSLFCINRTNDACGQCLECRKMQSGNHPGLHWVKPDGASIKIEQIRQLQQMFLYRHSEREQHVYIIEEADKMTVQAANSLLKFFEEPQPGIMGILLTENGQALLPTIRSRAQYIPFNIIPPQEMESVLRAEGYPLPLVRAAVHLRFGLQAARELLQNEAFAEMRNVVIQLGKETMVGFAPGSIAAQRLFHQSQPSGQMELFIDLFTLFLKDFVYIRYALDEMLIFYDQREWMEKWSLSRPLTYWVSCIDFAVKTRQRLRQNAQPQLALERLMYQIQGG